MAIEKLSAKFVEKVRKPGRYGDGGGLWLQVSRTGTKAWIFRFMLDGRARQMGLGGFDLVSLKEARDLARAARRQVRVERVDPIETRREDEATKKAKDAKQVTFEQAAERYIKAHEPGWRNEKHAGQWRNTIKTYAYPVIGQVTVAKVDTAHVMQILEPIWTSKTETASRVRGRVESVLDWAKARHYRSGENPARWRGHLDKLLPARSKIAKVRHHPALPYAELPAFMARLRQMDSISAHALEFAILTAARTGEVIGATEDEIDFAAKLWTISAERTKANRPHRVPLSNRAIEILKSTPREADSPYLFPSTRRKRRHLSNMAMLEHLRDMEGTEGLTVHGFRSTFRDWAAERTSYPGETAEMALAHAVRGVEGDYRRGDLLEKRRRLMTAWAAYALSAATSGSVSPIGRSAQA